METGKEMEKIQHYISYLPMASSESNYLCSCWRAEAFLHLSGDSKLQKTEELLRSLDSSGSCPSSSNWCCYSWKKSYCLEITGDTSKLEESEIQFIFFQRWESLDQRGRERTTSRILAWKLSAILSWLQLDYRGGTKLCIWQLDHRASLF